MSDRNPYTHGYGAPVLTSHRARTAANSAAHLLPHLRPGQRLLDVGSGAGTITADLARIVGPENVTAFEVAEESAALTRAELARQGRGRGLAGGSTVWSRPGPTAPLRAVWGDPAIA